MTFRQVVLWIHLAIGISAALVVLMMSATGVILTFEAQLNRLALRQYRSAPPPGSTPLSVDAIVAAVDETASGARITSVAVSADPREPAAVGVAAVGTLYVDRYTGRAIGDGETGTRRFLRAVMSWHRWFGLEGRYRIVGRTFTATANLGFLVLIVSGVFLWWPRGQAVAAWPRALRFRPGLTGRARHYNWHSVMGLWSAMPLAIIVASGATMSYQWAGNLVYRVVGEPPPSGAEEPPAGERVARPGPSVPSSTRQVALESLFQTSAATAGWRTITFTMPETKGELIRVTVDRGTGRQPSKSEDLIFDPRSGAVVDRAGYPTYSQGFRLRRWLRFAHTGEIYGVVGQSIAGLVSLGAVVLVWTGLAMSWTRFVRPGGGTPSPTARRP